MGSFNLTCAITKSTILEGQKVRVFFITNTGGYKGNTFNGCNCYPEDAYEVIGFPIQGKYDDYGRYSLDEDSQAAEITLKIIRENYIENLVEEGKTIDDYNEHHDHMNVSVNSLDWYQIQEMMHSGRLFVDSSKNKAHVAFMAVHEVVYQKMIDGNVDKLAKEISFVSDESIKESKEQRDSIKEIVESSMVIGHKFTKKVKKELTDKNMEEMVHIYRKELEDRCECFRIPEEDRESLINEALNKLTVGETITLKEEMICTEDNIESSKKHFLNELMKFYINPIGKNIKKQISDSRHHYGLYSVETELEGIDYGKLFAESHFVRNWLFSMNMMYSPTMTSGQCYDFKDHAKRLNELADIVSNLKE